MSENIRENCGIVLAHSLPEVYAGMDYLQHRGQEAAGVGAINGEGIDVVKWRGKVTDFSLDSLRMMLSGSRYTVYAGHVRYATKGRKDKILSDAHPHVIGGIELPRHEHKFIHNADAAIVHNGQIDAELAYQFIDRSKLKTDCDSEALLHVFKEIGIKGLLENMPKTYSAIFLDKKSPNAVVARDRHGRMPCWLGIDSNGKHVIASEDSAMRKNNWTPIRELNPGEVAYIAPITGNVRSEQIVRPEPYPCAFQRTYHMSPDSTDDGMLISALRERLGFALAEEFPRKADIITYVPRCPKPAAIGYAKATRQEDKFLEVFYKKKTTRVFMESTQQKRENEMEEGMYIFPYVDLRNKDVVVIDDSIIRGTESRRAVKLAREAGARKIYFMSYTPPIGQVVNDIKYGCEDGVDIPPEPQDEWNYAVRKYGGGEGTRLYLDADELNYLSLDRMLHALNMNYDKSCTTCMGGLPKPLTRKYSSLI